MDSKTKWIELKCECEAGVALFHFTGFIHIDTSKLHYAPNS